MIVTVLIFLIILSLLVFVHELGHFVMAKRAGMKVFEFGFGFPPRLFGIQKIDGKWRFVGGKSKADPASTVYSVNSIPLGGFVKIMGEDSEANDDPQSFANKSFFRRFITLAAGVLMNVILAWVLIFAGYLHGLPVAVQDTAQLPGGSSFSNQHVAVLEVRPGSPAEQGGIQGSDIIQQVDGESITSVSGLQQYISSHKNQDIHFTVKRINDIKDLTVHSLPEAGDDGIIGVGLATYGNLKFGFPQAFIQGAQTTYYQLTGIVTGLYKLFTAGQGLKSLGGPVKIAQLTGQVAQLGFIPLIQFTAFLSLNLAILNTLPLPALDGGRMLFLIIEKLRGRRNNPNVEQYANVIGFFALILLMLIITVRDVSQLESIKHLFS